MNSAIPSSCMDRYLNRYIVPHHPAQQQQQQQQLLNQQAAAAVAVAQNPNGFYQHQLLQQQQQQHHHQQQQQQQQQVQGHAPPPQNFMVGCYSSTNGWAGVPLISTAARRPRKFPSTIQNVPINHYQPASNKAEFDENAMSRLALHAHGAPLILANNRYRSNPNKSSGHPNKPKQVPSRDDHSLHQNKFNQNSANPQAVMSHPNDTHSVASDESSLGTTNSSSSSTSSDTCLPRIIKPRKRRKKDRKPNVQNVTPISGGSVTAVTSSTTSTLASSHPLSMGPGQLSANSALLLDETTRDFLNEIALIANAGGHFDFSGLPLIREQTQFVQQQQQQQQQLQMPPAQLQSQEQSQHFSSNNSDSSDSGINSLACSCRLCDPFGKIWAFPLRRSCSDNSAEIELNRAKDVGVIGSNRSNSFRSEWRSSPHSLDQPGSDQRQLSSQQPSQQEFGTSSSRKGSFSDSGDSGCDLLSGLTFCSEDILSSVNRELFMTPVDASKEFQFPSSTVPGSGGGGGGSGGNVVNNNSISGCVVGPGDRGDNSELLLISELTKKMNEGLDLGSSGSSDSGSGSSSSVFADGGMYNGGTSGGSADGSTNSVAAAAVAAATDMFVNFDAISRNNLFSVNNISKLSNLLFDDGLTAPALVMGSGQVIHSVNHGTSNGNGAGAVNYNRGNSVQNLQPPPPLTATNNSGGTSSNNSSSLFSDHQQFMFGVAADVERCCDRGVLNCFNGVWSNNVNDRKLLPVEE